MPYCSNGFLENSYSTYRDMYLHANKYFCNKKINIFFNLKTLNQPIKEEKKTSKY